MPDRAFSLGCIAEIDPADLQEIRRSAVLPRFGNLVGVDGKGRLVGTLGDVNVFESLVLVDPASLQEVARLEFPERAGLVGLVKPDAVAVISRELRTGRRKAALINWR